MKNTSRRTFLKQIFWGAGAMYISAHGLSVFATPKASKNVQDLLEIQKKARTAYYKQEHDYSAKLYKSLIEKKSSDIAYYDGLRKNLKRMKNETEIVSSLKSGIEKNPDNPLFYNRLAKYYREVSTGNRKTEKVLAPIEETEDLLERSIEISAQAIDKDSTKKYLYYELLESLYARQQREDEESSSRAHALTSGSVPFFIDEKYRSLIAPYYPEWSRLKFPAAITPRAVRPLPPDLIQNVKDEELLLEKVDMKQRRPLYIESEIKQRKEGISLYKKQVNVRMCRKKILQEDNIEEAVVLTKNILRSFPGETDILGFTVNACEKRKRYDLIVSIYEDRATYHNNFWTQAGLAKAYRKSGQFAKAESIYKSFDTSESWTTKQLGVIYGGLAQCAIALDRAPQAEIYIEEALKRTYGLGGGSLFFFFLYLQLLIINDKFSSAEMLLLNLLSTQPVTSASGITRYIWPDKDADPDIYTMHQLYKPKTVPKGVTIQILCELAKLYKEYGETVKFTETLNRITALDPENSFVKNQTQAPLL